MTIPWGAIATAAGTVAATGVNAYSTGRTNRKTRKWNEHMYEKQLTDNIRLWEMQNQYNSPEAQMARFKKAGLNPNLIYGNGDASAMSRSAPSGADVKSWDPQPVSLDPSAIGDIMGRYVDMRLKQAQTDNVQHQVHVTQAEVELKKAQTMATLKQAGYTDVQIQKILFDLDQAKKLAPYQLSQADANVNKTNHEIQKIQADTEYTINQDVRAAAQNSASIQEAMERIARSRAERSKIPAEKEKLLAEIKDIRNSTKLKELDIVLKEQGIQPGDPMYMRILKEVQVKGFKVLDNVREWVIDQIKTFHR